MLTEINAVVLPAAIGWKVGCPGLETYPVELRHYDPDRLTPLAFAVIEQAAKDAQGKGYQAAEARKWLFSDGLTWLDYMGIQMDEIELEELLKNYIPRKVNESERI